MTPEDYQRRKTVFLLVLYLFVACILCPMAGPASAVLMIPHRDWFFDQLIDRSITEPSIRAAGWEKLEYYPNILIGPRLGNGVIREPLFSSGYLHPIAANQMKLCSCSYETIAYIETMGLWTGRMIELM